MPFQASIVSNGRKQNQARFRSHRHINRSLIANLAVSMTPCSMPLPPVLWPDPQVFDPPGWMITAIEFV